jgi:hypothetical protein
MINLSVTTLLINDPNIYNYMIDKLIGEKL